MQNIEQLGILFGTGNYQECIACCEKILSRNPDSVVAVKWAGKCLLALGRLDEAQRILTRAHQLDPEDPEVVKDIGNCLLNKGEHEQAASAYKRSLTIQANYAPAIYNLAGVAQISGDYKSAIELFVKAAELDSSLNQAWTGAAKCALSMNQWDTTLSLCSKALAANNTHKGIYRLIGDAHRGKGELAEALQAYKREIELSPEDAIPLVNAANIMRGLNRAGDAIKLLTKALKLKPENYQILSNLGCMLNDAERYAEAEQYCQRATILNPDHAESYGNLGIALFELGKIAEALDATKKAITLDPKNAGFHTNLGSIYIALGNHDKAVKYQLRALDLDPFDKEAHTGLACIHLAKGKFSHGWDGYSHRPQKPCLQKIPVWDGSKKKRVLVIGEQGIGDQILYASIIQEAQQLCEQLELRVDQRLLSLFSRSFSGNIQLAPLKAMAEIPPCDAYIAMADLGKLLRKSLADFSAEDRGYLSADDARTSALRERLKSGTDKKIIGLSWHSAGKGYKNRSKSVDLSMIATYLNNVGAQLVCLQYGSHRQEVDSLHRERGIHITQIDEIDLYDDIDGTASLISACDAVVTVSNVTAHLAGALGKKTHLLVPRSPNFCWGLESSKTIWYPSLSLYRQSVSGNWLEPIEQITKTLADTSAWQEDA